MSVFPDGRPLEGAYSKVSRRVLPLLLLGYVVAYLDRVNVGFAKLQMLQDLNFSETIYGLGAGVFFVGYFLFEVPSNMILHRVGARRWIARIMITWGLISAAMMFVQTPLQFYVFRFLLGAAEAGFFPGVILYLTQWYPAERRGRVTAIFMTGIAICSVIGSMLSGWIMQTFDGVRGWSGWQWLFLIEGTPAILFGVYIFFRLTDSIAAANWLTDAEKSLLISDLNRDAGSKPQGSLATAFCDRRVWLACLIYFCLITGLYGVGFWLPTIIFDMGVKNPMEIGMLTAIPYSVAAIGMVLVGRSADRSGERRWHVAAPAAIGATGLVLSTIFSNHMVVGMMTLALATFGILTSVPLFWSLPTAYLRGAAAAAGIALINSFGNLAGFASPYLIGWVKDSTGSTTVGLYCVAGFVLGGAALVIAAIPAYAVNRVDCR